MKKYLFLCIYSLLSQFAFAQNTNFTIKEIDSIVLQIEASCISGGITDYIIKSKRKGKRKKILGGGADWYYTDISGTKLLKVVRELSLESENFDTYYFYQDSLIYLKTTNARYNGDKKIMNWSRRCYFSGETLYLTQDNLKITFAPKNYIETAKEFFTGHQIWRRN
jgi:hypothetical protein